MEIIICGPINDSLTKLTLTLNLYRDKRPHDIGVYKDH